MGRFRFNRQVDSTQSSRKTSVDCRMGDYHQQLAQAGQPVSAF